MILIIDNYDSFTFNLVDLIRSAGCEVEVHRNDGLSVDEALARGPEAVVISPGPGRPRDAGISVELLRRAPQQLPVLGVCLGHQVIAEAFGGAVVPAPTLVHGCTSPVLHDGEGLFEDMKRPFDAMRYHSWVVSRTGFPPELEITAWLDDPARTVMGLRHRRRPIHGIQFHPESFLTLEGPTLVRRFLTLEKLRDGALR